MRAPKPWTGFVGKDGLKLDDKAGFHGWAMGKFIGQEVVLTLHGQAYYRSLAANNYYWSCVLDPMEKHSGQKAEEIHDAMCARFIPNEPKRVEFFNTLTGEVLEVETDGRRSSKLSGTAFYDFVEEVRQFALDWMQLTTEDPDPLYWRKRGKRKKAA